ncbi:hypothetical protein [Niabella sp.]|uniref:hypothetical protein n=1 Tax=Niabella sp. TaxID=1962976 RepID=UPI00262D48D7|nr:hypothetical protein [Niabella sp.]
MKYKTLIACCMFPLWLQAQDCSKEMLQQKPGTWKAGPQGSVINISAADLIKEKSLTATIHKMVSTNYKPVGCEISYSTVYGKYPGTGQTFIADPYHYAMYVLRYLCDADKSRYYVDNSTPTTVNITANVIYSLDNLYAANLPADDPRGYLKLKRRPEKKDGYYFLGDEVVGDNHLENKIKEYRWLITYNDTLPFSYLSQKEYVRIQKKRLEQALQDSPGEKAYISKFLDNIAVYLKKPETELMKPAICMWNEEEWFEKFVEEGTPGSFIAVIPNLAYYRKNLPKSSPQFFTVVYKIAHGDPVFEANIANIKNAIDFAKLKNMLGK